MKNFWPLKIKFTFYRGSFKSSLDLFAFWQIVVSIFFVGLAFLAGLHLYIFYSLGSLSLETKISEKEESLFDQEKLRVVVENLKMKQENFGKYFNKKPDLKDPSKI